MNKSGNGAEIKDSEVNKSGIGAEINEVKAKKSGNGAKRDNDHKCDHCPKSFKRLKDLNRH